MGLAASQARYLSLTARKTNVEYEGQQINQERTSLANQSAGLYNQMLSLDVPTPPAASDYSKTYYSFVDASTSSSMTIDWINPPYTDENGQTRYSVQTTRSFTDQLATYVELPNVEVFAPAQSDDNKNYQISFNNGTSSTLTGPISAKGLSNSTYFGQAQIDAGVAENDRTNFADETPEQYFTFTYNNLQYYVPAKITTTDITDADGEVTETQTSVETAEEFMQRMNSATDKIYAYTVEGITKTEAKTYEDVILQQANDGTGRYESMVYTAVDENGNKTTQTLKLTQQTIQDEDAYNAAMDTYNAEKAIYDKTIAEIDQKTAIIQQQDKNLELHLDQLDTEQQAIQTEMDAVKKVIDKNIEETFKTFA